MQKYDDFPVDLLPVLIKSTIYEVHQITKAPIPLIGASVLGAISLVCQSQIDVIRPGNLRGPVSLFLLTLAGSGERKTTVDNLLMEPLRRFEEQLNEDYLEKYSDYLIELNAVKTEIKALNTELRAQVRRKEDTLEIKKALNTAHKSLPEPPVKYKMTFNDATPAAIKEFLCKERWKSVGIMSDEAGAIFNGHTLNDLPFINKMWDGGKFTVDRKNEPEATIHDARMTLSLMVQPEVFTAYLERRGEQAKGVGFFARSLICLPTSTQGTRLIESPVISREHLPVFHRRLMDIATESLTHNGQGREGLLFSSDAEKLWIEFHNRTESRTGSNGDLASVRDYASKVAENVARVAALLHHFCGFKNNISTEVVKAAIDIINWYGNQYIDLFVHPDESQSFEKDLENLFAWIQDECLRSADYKFRKNRILQSGPNRLRNKERTNELLYTLVEREKIILEQWGKTWYIRLNQASSLMVASPNNSVWGSWR
ncbi:DUF3987 domain-containing protein [Enterobacter kobei]|nr:DUF3987 domain-containing protein [Enterobacter kobei]ELK6139068.1 DUF3987 domain-containing protein [Enterobacter kobei]ELY4831814.1 DUF3987 domain-containing protein [Cronobacter sakazakii]